MSAQHTSKPWRVINASPRADNTTAYLMANHPWEDSQANARLIAAAPELLAALEATIQLLVMLGDFIANKHGRCEVILSARAAIAKAKGEA